MRGLPIDCSLAAALVVAGSFACTSGSGGGSSAAGAAGSAGAMTGGGGTPSGGTSSGGTSSHSGGSTASGGTHSGGSTSSGGGNTGGARNTGGTQNTGGASSTGGNGTGGTSSGGTGGTGGMTYTTNFPLTENPISEGGRWLNGKHDGIDWTDVATTPGKAFGDPSTGGYTDPTAILKGAWGPDQTVTAKAFCAKPTASYYQEVEIRLRSAVSAHSITGYEILFRCLTDSNAYTQVVRWNGPVTQFTYLDQRSGVGYGVADGDTVSASIVGNVITVYRNGSKVLSVTDNTYTTGNPGMGFNYGVGSTNADFGFTSFTATSN